MKLKPNHKLCLLRFVFVMLIVADRSIAIEPVQHVQPTPNHSSDHSNESDQQRRLAHFRSTGVTHDLPRRADLKSYSKSELKKTSRMEIVIDPFTTLIVGKMIGLQYGLVASKLASLGSVLKNRCCTTTPASTTSTSTAGALVFLSMPDPRKRKVFGSPIRDGNNDREVDDLSEDIKRRKKANKNRKNQPKSKPDPNQTDMSTQGERKPDWIPVNQPSTSRKMKAKPLP
jgi:hypothetical protein